MRFYGMFMCEFSNKDLKFLFLSKRTFYIYLGFREALSQNCILKLFNLEQLKCPPSFNHLQPAIT